MRETFDSNKRHQNPNWIIIQINCLLKAAEKLKNSSYVLYASLEARTLIERIEYELILMSAHKFVDNEWIEEIKKYHGLQKANKNYKTLKFKYQSFTEAFTLVVANSRITPFDYNKAEELLSKLSQYIHIYTVNDNDLNYENNFIQDGMKLINEAISFIQQFLNYNENGCFYVALDFSTLESPASEIFRNWINDPSQEREKIITTLSILACKKRAP